MRIAVNTRFLMPGKLEGFGVYTHEIMRRMVDTHTEDLFHFCFDRAFDEGFLYGENVVPHKLYPPARHPFLFVIWYQLRLKRLVERTDSDILFSPDSFMPLGMKKPTVITIHDVAYKRFPEYISKSNLRYYEMYMPRFAKEAAHILTVSEFSKREICSFFDVSPSKVTAVYNGVNPAFKPVTNEERMSVRDRFANGKPYFLYVGAIHPRKNIARLIEAYDIFKNENASDLQLVIAGRHSWNFDDVKSAYASSPYRDDIHMPGYVPFTDLPGLVGSAYGMCYTSLYEGFGIPVAESMACGVPVIVSSEESTGAVLAEVGGDAVLQADPLRPSEIAASMRRLVSDPELYERLRRTAMGRASLFSWSRASDTIYDILQRTIRMSN